MSENLPEMKLMKGAIDIHMHCMPDTVQRRMDEIEMAGMARDYGMRALLLKCHDTMTADRAYYVNKVVEDIEVFGGVVLNYAVGGFNPHAVVASIQFGGKCVWMPTRSAAYYWEYLRRKGFTGASGTIFNPFERKLVEEGRLKGLMALTPKGELLPEIIEILGVIADADIMLGTGHLDPKDEQKGLISEAMNTGVKKIVVTHPLMDHPPALIPYPKDELVDLAKKGVYMDLPYIMMSGWKFVTGTPDAKESYYTPRQYANMIKTIGAEHCVMSTDFGQVHNPPPPEGLRIFIRAMMDNGISDREIKMMVSENPAKLLGIK